MCGNKKQSSTACSTCSTENHNFSLNKKSGWKSSYAMCAVIYVCSKSHRKGTKMPYCQTWQRVKTTFDRAWHPLGMFCSHSSKSAVPPTPIVPSWPLSSQDIAAKPYSCTPRRYPYDIYIPRCSWNVLHECHRRDNVVGSVFLCVKRLIILKPFDHRQAPAPSPSTIMMSRLNRWTVNQSLPDNWNCCHFQKCIYLFHLCIPILIIIDVV